MSLEKSLKEEWLKSFGENEKDLLRLLIEEANDGIYVLDMEGKFRYANRKAEEISGYREEEWFGIPFLQMIAPEYKVKIVEIFKERLKGSTGPPYELEIIRKDGTRLPIEISTKAITIEDKVFVKGFVRDISEKKRLENEILQLSITDGLTGLYNHRHFYQRLSEYSHPFSLILIDVDDFKKYNDDFGHKAGDKVLQDIANIITDTVRGNDIAARYGGEEFVIILPDIHINEAKDIAENIRKNVSEHNFGHRKMTISVGVSEYSQNINLKLLVENADKAMYHAKNSGKNKVKVWGNENAFK